MAKTVKRKKRKDAVIPFRPMRYAPKNGTQILLAYKNDAGTLFVNQGRWVDAPTTEQVELWIKQVNVVLLPECPAAHKWTGWMISYLADITHTRYAGKSFRVSYMRVDPIGWMPLPDSFYK